MLQQANHLRLLLKFNAMWGRIQEFSKGGEGATYCKIVDAASRTFTLKKVKFGCVLRPLNPPLIYTDAFQKQKRGNECW